MKRRQNTFSDMHHNWILLVLLIDFSASVEVHFEATNSGFFFKHSRQPPVTPEISNVQLSHAPSGSRSSFDSVLSVDRFTIVENTQPVSIRASYGPFSTKQTVPARYIVPMENQADYLNNTTAALIELQQTSMHLDISAHLVRSVVAKDSPVLRVLFHTGADPGGHLQRQKVCVLLQVSMHSRVPLKGRCIPEDEDGVCVAEVVIPSNWWPLIQSPHEHNTSRAPVKHPQRIAQVYYSVFEPPLRNSELCEPKVQIQPMTLFAQVPLIPATNGFKELRADESITILVPQNSLYPMSKFHVPVFLHQNSIQNIEAIIIKARVKSGLKILGATVSNDSWTISIEKENPKLSTARVSVFKKDPETHPESKRNYPDNGNISSIELFSWLLEVSDDSKETLEGVKIVWSLTYVLNDLKVKHNLSEITTGTDNGKKKVVAKLYINKDDIQSVLPMAKNWELMNTAVLTGRQVAQAMKVFIVSQAGKVADVTLQSSCHADDESVIKVSSSCSSVYVDGSEIRGSSNASVLVKYGSYAGIAKFIVWMPEFPLEVYAPDFRLSQIKGWKVVDENVFLHNKHINRRRKRSYAWGQHDTGFSNNFGHDKTTCKARYQQSPVDVYARFLAVDQNSGRISYFISRRTGLRITDLVQPLLRVADPKIASLKGRILEGKSMGRTDVQVLSPITGRVIGAKEIRVGSDKVSLSKLIVRVVSGLQLTIAPDSTIINGYLAETYVTHKLTAQYQEGLLDIDLEFSDGSISPLRDIPAEDYFLLVESLDTEVVAFAPMLASHHPRVIAVGEGNGNLLRVALLLPEDCRLRRNSPTKQFKSTVVPLSSALAAVEVDFNTDKHESVQNDGTGRDKKSFRAYGDLADIIGIPLGMPNHIHEPTVQAKQHRGSEHYVDKLRKGKRIIYTDMTALEVGMYIVLTAFCFAIAAFVVSCFVYASKFRPVEAKRGIEPSVESMASFNTNLFPRLFKEQTTNAHDWVWLGRSTLDKSSEATTTGNFDSRVRITNNPINNIPNECKSISSFDKNSAQPNLENKNIKDKVENFISSSQVGLEKSIDYRPPVPPHRCLGAPAIVNSSIQNTKTPREQYDNQNQWQRHKAIISKSSSNQMFMPHELNLENKRDVKLCKTENLVDNLFRLKKNAFQFDSLNPNKKDTVSSKGQCTNQVTPLSSSLSSIESLHSKKFRVKRASVVGNPMFSANKDDTSLVENLTLDDLGMDYEQIMHYFDNLKESNA